ncbi:hypothetical protein, partial [Streptomyces eurythermus]|uniref:hypothetical protein n=1 Tax=Streptomyces eurythermus TaxID=42237 RepID=UPI003F4D43BA
MRVLGCLVLPVGGGEPRADAHGSRHQHPGHAQRHPAPPHRTPVMLLSDGYLANGSDPWRIPELERDPHRTGRALGPAQR